MNTYPAEFASYPQINLQTNPASQGGHTISPFRKDNPYTTPKPIAKDAKHGNPHTHHQRDYYSSFHPVKLKRIIFTGILQESNVILNKILPRKQVDDMFFDKISVIHHFATTGLVPNEALTKVQVSTREEQSLRMEKYGLGFYFNRASLKEEEGRNDYKDAVKQLSISFRTSDTLRGIMFLMEVRSYEDAGKYINGDKTIDLDKFVRKSAQNYAPFSMKDHRKLLAEMAVAKLGMVSDPNILLLSPDISVLLPKQDQQPTYYYDYSQDLRNPTKIYGDEVKSVLKSGDIEWFFAPPIKHVENYEGGTSEAMRQVSQVSEFYIMKDSRSLSDRYMKYDVEEKGLELYDARTDKWQRISFSHAFNNSNIFEGNDWSPDFINWIGHSSRNYTNPMDGPEGSIFVYRGYDQRLKPIECLGQMRPEVIGKCFEHMAESIIGKFSDSDKDIEIYTKAIRNGLKLRDSIRAERYSGDVNSPKGKFMAKLKESAQELILTDTERARKHGASIMREAKTNGYGSVDLPKSNVFGGSKDNKFFPLGFSNFANLRTLSLEVNDEYYGEWAKVARDFCDAVKDIHDFLKNLLPESKFLDKENTPIWIPKEGDGLNVFAETFFPTPPPLFLVEGAVPQGLQQPKEHPKDKLEFFSQELNEIIDKRHKGKGEEDIKKLLDKEARKELHALFMKKFHGRLETTKFLTWLSVKLGTIKESKAKLDPKALIDEFSKSFSDPKKTGSIEPIFTSETNITRFSLGASQALAESLPDEWKVGNPNLFNETYINNKNEAEEIYMKIENPLNHIEKFRGLYFSIKEGLSKGPRVSASFKTEHQRIGAGVHGRGEMLRKKKIGMPLSSSSEREGIPHYEERKSHPKFDINQVYSEIESPSMMSHWESIEGITNPITKSIIHVILTTCKPVKTFKHLFKKGIYPPFDIMLIRPIIRNWTTIGILTREDVGNTIWVEGESNVFFEQTGRFYTSSVNPSLPYVDVEDDVIPIADISLNGYISGAGMDFIRKGGEAIKTADLMDQSYASESLIAFPIAKNIPPRSDIIYLADNDRYAIDGIGYLESLFNFADARNYYRDMCNEKQSIAFAAMSGSCRRFDTKTGRYTIFEQGSGPLGDKTYQGCLDVWNGNGVVQNITSDGVVQRMG